MRDEKEQHGYLVFAVLCILSIGIAIGEQFRPISRVVKIDSYTIVAGGKLRDVRRSPHFDLIRPAWTNSTRKLLLRIEPNGSESYYNWLEDKWDKQ